MSRISGLRIRWAHRLDKSVFLSALRYSDQVAFFLGGKRCAVIVVTIPVAARGRIVSRGK